MELHERLQRVQPDVRAAHDVGVSVDVVGVDVVLDNVLVDPGRENVLFEKVVFVSD